MARQTNAATWSAVVLSCLFFTVISTPAHSQSHPDLSGLSRDERVSIEAACSSAKYGGGPAAYNQCLQDQLGQLSRGTAHPDLSGLSRDEHVSIEAACSSAKNGAGPAAYNQCLQNQLGQLSRGTAHPDLSGLSRDEHVSIEAACSSAKYGAGPAAYNQCLQNQLGQLSRGTAHPDLSGLSRDEHVSIEAACSSAKYGAGPAAYNQCLRKQLNALREYTPSIAPPSNQASAISVQGSSTLPSSEKTVAADKEEQTPSRGTQANGYNSGEDQPTGTGQRGRQTNSSTKKLSAPTYSPSSPDAITPIPPPTSSKESKSRSEDSPWTILISLAVVALLANWVVKASTKRCPKCGSRARAGTTYCLSCTATIAEETRTADTQRRAEERARVEQQRRQREQQEEERHREWEHHEEEKRRRLRTLEQLQQLTGTKFEELIASLFKNDGYAVRHCGGAGDEGIDLVLEISKTKDVVQCKRWKHDVGSPVIRDFFGAMMHACARHGFIITTASYSQSARAFARGKPITLISGGDIIRWIDGTYSSRTQQQKQQRKQNDAAADPEKQQEDEKQKQFDPFAVLGIIRGATEDEIRAAYRREMSNYHPDKVAHLGAELRELADRKAHAINRAYAELIRQRS